MSSYVPLDPMDLFAQQPYGGTAPFEAGSETSRAAAQAITPGAPTLRTLVLTEIGLAGGHGMTDKELEAKTNLGHETASARRRELVLLGLVRDSGQKRKTPSGRNAVVWVRV